MPKAPQAKKSAMRKWTRRAFIGAGSLVGGGFVLRLLVLLRLIQLRPDVLAHTRQPRRNQMLVLDQYL